MKSAAIVLALALAANADYIEVRQYTESAACDGHAAFTSNSFIGCTESDDVSFRIQCTGHTEGSYLLYLSSDCSGQPISNTTAPVEFGCDASGDMSSMSTYCEKGNYVPDDHAVNQYYYLDQSCPVPEGTPFYAVNSFPTGDCNHLDGGMSYDYACSDTAMIAQYYMGEDCQGDPISASDVVQLGCVNSDDFAVDTVCNIDPNATKTVRPPAVPMPAEVLAKIQAAAMSRVDSAHASQIKAMAAAPKKA